MHICLLTDQELDAEPFDPDDWPCDPRPFIPEAEWTLLTLEKDSAVQRVIEATRRGFDVFVNLCDGAWDEGRVGIEVVQTLEGSEVAFTGADTAFYEPSREAMKRVCQAWGIGTPAHAIVRRSEEIERAARILRFPLFVKHPSSYASNGLTRASRVETPEALDEQASRMIAAFGGALVEEYIDGLECTVLVAENPEDPSRPTAYQPIQYRFPEGEAFKHYELKWVNYHGLEAFPVTDPDLDARLRAAATDFFLGMRGAGYARCDVRVDGDGNLFMLEINPNCGVFFPPTDPGSADLCLRHDPAGHEGFTRQIVAAALARHRRRDRGWEVRWLPEGEYGIYATRAFASGERVMVFEEQAHHLVTRAHVERHWDARRRDWFDRYAWPLTDELWVMWSDDPDEWRPINHACEPSAWLEGLDVVARRAIARGEQITVDYATFYDERLPPFACTCGAEECRGIVSGDDCLADFVQRYGQHVSDHIRRKRAERLVGDAPAR